MDELLFLQDRINKIKEIDPKTTITENLFNIINDLKDDLLFFANYCKEPFFNKLNEAIHKNSIISFFLLYIFSETIQINEKGDLWRLQDIEDLKLYNYLELQFKNKQSNPDNKIFIADEETLTINFKKEIITNITAFLYKELNLKYINSNINLKAIYTLINYTSKKDFKDNIYIDGEDSKIFSFAFNKADYKKIYFDFLKEPNKDTYIDFTDFYFIRTLTQSQLFMLYNNPEKTPEEFTEATKQFFNDFKNIDYTTNPEYNEHDYFILQYFNFIYDLQDIKRYYALILDLHNYIIKTAEEPKDARTQLIETRALPTTKDTHEIALTDKAYNNISGAIENFKDLNYSEATKDTITFSGYLKTIAKNKKEAVLFFKQFFELKKQQPEITRLEALDIIAPKRNKSIMEFIGSEEFEKMDFTSQIPFNNFDIDTSNNLITSKYNSMELCVDFGNALTLTKDNRETKEFLRFIIKKYIDNKTNNKNDNYIDFTIFEYETHKGNENHTQEIRTKNKIDSIITALDFARIKQNQKLISNGEAHILKDSIKILGRITSDENLSTNKKEYRIKIDEDFRAFIDYILDKENGGQHITYINKKITDLTKTNGNNGLRQKARYIAEYLTELKRIRENKPQYKNDFFDNNFIYTCTIKDIINLLLSKHAINKNYNKSFKRLCVDILQDTFKILLTNDIADYQTEAFTIYNEEIDENIKKSGRVIAIKKNKFLTAEITFILKDIYKARTYKQILAKEKHLKKK